MVEEAHDLQSEQLVVALLFKSDGSAATLPEFVTRNSGCKLCESLSRL